MGILRTKNIVKIYPGTRALDDLSLSFDSGKVHALIGKNGSGKSTLVKIFAGAIQPTEGKFFLDGTEKKFSSPIDARENGIATVFQELSLIPYLTVAENIFLGRLPKRGKVIDWKKTFKMAGDLLESMNVDIDPHELIYKLSMWQCQVIEITKAMSFKPQVLLLDEPTSALAASETEQLFKVIRDLKKKDVIIIYISHRLQELWEIADTVTVLRDGKYIGNKNLCDLEHKDIIKMMFGKVKPNVRPSDLHVYNETILKVENLNRKAKFKNINFELKKGEILGIAGMLGSGRTELLRSIFGADPFDSGTITIKGEKVDKSTNPVKMKALGLGLTPEERKTQGVILMHSIKDNLCYSCLDRLSNHHIIDDKKRLKIAKEQIEHLEIKIPNIESPVNSLSGGNQQKIVIGNWLNNLPDIMMYDEPTRGIDVNAKGQIFQIMWDQSRKGISSIFVSSELEELLEVCHRIIIMHLGEIVGEVNPDDLQIDDLYAICMRGRV